VTGKRIALAVSAVALAISSAASADDATLLKQAQELFRPLPRDLSTPGTPGSKDQAYLGRLLFFDPRITVDGTVSCATCHQPSLYGTDALPTSIGVKQRLHPRNAPTVLNAALNFVNHWRGDRESVEDQAMQALTAPISSGHDERAVVDRLARIPGYVSLFQAAFAGERSPITAKTAGAAIGAFERTLFTPSRFDAYLGGNVNAL
jgi:cytochrome c peroxidase